MLTKSIAIIDDEIDLVTLFTEALKVNGFKVCGYTDPLEALNYIGKHPEEYGLVITDYRMPALNGYELGLKLMKLNPNLKVVLMSAYDDIHYDKTKFQFFSKPIHLTTMMNIIGGLDETQQTLF